MHKSVFKIKKLARETIKLYFGLIENEQSLLKFDTLAHVAALKLYHNRSIEFGDRGQLCNYTYTTHSFTTACVTHVDQVIKQLVVLMGIINVESGGLIGDTFR